MQLVSPAFGLSTRAALHCSLPPAGAQLPFHELGALLALLRDAQLPAVLLLLSITSSGTQLPAPHAGKKVWALCPAEAAEVPIMDEGERAPQPCSVLRCEVSRQCSPLLP